MNDTDMISRINCLTGELDMLYHQAAKKLGVPDSILRILYAISGLGDGCRPTDVCRLAGLSKQTVNSALRRLECENILKLEHRDGRCKQLRLTELGKQRVAESAGRLGDAERRATESFSEAEAAEYLRLMEKFNVAFAHELKYL